MLFLLEKAGNLEANGCNVVSNKLIPIIVSNHGDNDIRRVSRAAARRQIKRATCHVYLDNDFPAEDMSGDLDPV